MYVIKSKKCYNFESLKYQNKTKYDIKHLFTFEYSRPGNKWDNNCFVQLYGNKALGPFVMTSLTLGLY